MDKNELRKIMMEKRDSLPREYVEDSGRLVLHNLKKAGVFRGVSCVFIYVSMKNELPTRGIIDFCLNNNITVCVPRIEKSPAGRLMKPYRIDDPDRDLAPGHFGVLEPVFAGEEAAGREVLPGDIDIVFLPGTAFDLQGNRIGYGKGYYDSYLAKFGQEGAGRHRHGLSGKDLSGIGQSGVGLSQGRAELSGVGLIQDSPDWDRALLHPPGKIALCYDFQVVESFTPQEHDIPVDMIVTEKRVIRCGE